MHKIISYVKNILILYGRFQTFPLILTGKLRLIYVILPSSNLFWNMTVVQMEGYLDSNTVYMLFVDIRKAYDIGIIF
jgi:hypothetical protein